MKSEHFSPRQHMWLSFIHRDRRHRSGPRPSRFREPHLQSPWKLKALPKQPCVQSYTPSGRIQIDFVVSLSTLV
ncbi:hypothetical protein CDL15_Pgr020306 [Punica granatum]|nr:hypothetical protein CDL15_Pgr020306 [Punica granatum]